MEVENNGAAPVEVPAAPAPEAPVEVPAPAEQPAAAAPTIQPGQSPTDLDFDAMLDEIDDELAAEQQQPAEPQEANPAQPAEQPAAEEEPAKPQTPEPQAPAEPSALDPSQTVNIDDYDRYFNVTANEELGIAPIGEIRNPEPGESAQDYYKAVTLPAIVQTVKNMTGFATHNQQVSQRAQEAEAVERDQRTIAEIDGLIKDNKMPAYTLQDGTVDPSSEGGKVIAEVLKMATEYNSKPENANQKVTSFSHAFHQLYLPAQQEAAKQAKQEQAQQRRSSANAVLNGGSNGAGAGGSRQAQHIQKGQSVTDLNFDDLLG